MVVYTSWQNLPQFNRIPHSSTHCQFTLFSALCLARALWRTRSTSEYIKPIYGWKADSLFFPTMYDFATLQSLSTLFFTKVWIQNRVPIVYLSLIATCKWWIVLTPNSIRYSIVLQMISFFLRYVPGVSRRILPCIFFNWRSCTYATLIGKLLVKYQYFTRGKVYLQPWFVIIEAEASWWCS
jgi:hypothetical protein